MTQTRESAAPRVESSLPRRQWSAALFAGVAWALSTLVGLAAHYGEDVPGCGASSACGSILFTRWSQSFGVPVAWFGSLLYGGAAAASALPAPSKTTWLGNRFELLLSTLAASILLGAAWFVGLQGALLGSWCKYCIAIHASGVACAALMLWRLRNGGAGAMRDALAKGGRIAVAGLALLMIGQLVGPLPATHRVARYSYGKGQVRLTSDDAPIVGNRFAPHVALELFDYTCPTCRKLAPMLVAARARYGDQLAVIALPCPIERKCNPFVMKGTPDHENACQYARIAAAVWLEKPEEFAAFHENLLLEEPLCALEEAEARAMNLIGREAYAARRADPRIDQLINRGTHLYRGLGQGVMPKLLLGDMALKGTPNSQDELNAMLEEHLGVIPLSNDAAQDQTARTSAPVEPRTSPRSAITP